MHLTKYHLLLKRYTKLLNENHDKEYKSMSQALNLMESVNDQINSNLTGLETDQKIILEQNECLSQDLSLNYGEIIKEGELFLVETKKTHYAFLYENLFLIKKSFNSTKIIHSIPVSCKFQIK